MSVQIACPHCDASYSVADNQIGELGNCTNCGSKFPLVPGTRHGDELSTASETDLDASPLANEPNLPESFGRYKVLRRLGKGAMGTVYLALDTQLKRQVALKVPHIHALADQPRIKARFFREAEAAARIDHPNFCPIYDISEVEGAPYLAMKFIEGNPLAASIVYNQGWPDRKAADVARQLAVALAELHRQGVIHRDLKPANIMVDARGGLVLMDFGLARWHDDLDSTITPTGAILGTPSYLPPEQLEADQTAIGPRSDLYSLGIILYELLTGRRPYEGSILKVLGMIAYGEPQPPSIHRPDIDSRLEAICLKAMARNPADRYASMDEFAAALSGFLGEAQSSDGRGFSTESTTDFGIELDRAPIVQRGKAGVPTPVPKIPVKPSKTLKDGEVSRSHFLKLFVVGIGAGLVILSGIFYKGRIRIDVNDPNAIVQVDGQIKGLGETITLEPGKHDLSVKRGDITVHTRKFDVSRGDNPALSVTLEPPPESKYDDPVTLTHVKGSPKRKTTEKTDPPPHVDSPK